MKIKIQHYVPRFYLENFAKIKGKKAFLECFDKSENRAFSADIWDICCEKYFYDKSEDKNQEMEKALATLEGNSKSALIELIKIKDPEKLPIEDKIKISLFAATQYMRTKERREAIEDSLKQTIKILSKEKLAPKLEKQVMDMKSNFKKCIKDMHIDLIKEVPQIAKIIFQMKWTMIINKTKTPFWTSDNPIVIHNSIDHYPYGNLGFTKSGIELHFPLNPRTLLVMCDPITFYHEPSKKTIRDFRYVIWELHQQMNSSTRFIFSNNADFSFAKKVIKDSPEVADIKRKRIVVN